MKIGVLINQSQPEDMEKKFADVRDFGMDSCQLCSWEPALWTEENALQIKDLAARYGVEISAFWCGWEGPKVWDFYEGPTTLGLVPAAYRGRRIQNLCDGADFARRLGVTDVATHMGFIPEDPNCPDFIPFCDAVRKVAEHLKKNGQYLLFETGQETPVTMLRCFETVATDNLGINLDTANLILYGKANPVDALDVFGSYVRNIHAKDGFYPTCGHSLGNEVPIGEGKVDFRAFFEKLKALGYDSYVTIEREIEGEAQKRDIIHAKAYLETIINEIYGG